MEKSRSSNSSKLIYRIGGTTYRVKVLFSDTGQETMEDKVLRLVRSETLDHVAKCGIIEPPQMSQQSERSAS